jgi:hypothetical protein
MHYYYILDELWCMLDVFKFCFKHEQCNIHWFNIVLLFIVSISYACYCTVDEFFAWMLDLCNDSGTCTSCFWLVATLVGAFGWWLTHSISMVCELVSHLWLVYLNTEVQYSTIQYSTN